jgi:hypothetical protein
MARPELMTASAVVLALVSFARTQPTHPVPVAPPPHAAKPSAEQVNLASFVFSIDDPAVRNELKLTADQVRRFRTLRQREWDFEYNSTPAEYTARRAERTGALGVTVRAVLEPDQLARAEQLALQLEWRTFSTWRRDSELWSRGLADPTRITPGFLTDHPRIAAALELTEDQKKFVRAAPTSAVHRLFLSPEQADRARRVLGRLVPTDWPAPPDPRQSTRPSRGYSGVFGMRGLLRDPGNRLELKLSKEQVQQLEKTDWPSDAEPWNADLSPAALCDRVRKVRAAFEKTLAGILTPEQVTRFRQLLLREYTEPQPGLSRDPLIVALAAELNVTPEQQEKLHRARLARAEIIARSVVEDEYPAARKTIRAASTALEKDLLAVLTPAQQAQLRALVGEPRTVPRHGGLFGPALTDDVRKAREESFGSYTDELGILSTNRAIQRELNLTRDQIDLVNKSDQERMRRLVGEWGGNKPQPATAAEKSRFIGEALASVLDQKQARRFRQIMMQQREYAVRPFDRSIRSAATYPGVAEELKLSAEQRKRLIEGEHAAEVLTDQQWTSLRASLGDRYTGDAPFDPLARFGPRGVPAPQPKKTPQPVKTPRINREQARAEFLTLFSWEPLALSPEQATQLTALLNAANAPHPTTSTGNPWRSKGPEQPESEDVTRPEVFDARLRKIPGADKTIERLDQLILQGRAAINLRDAFNLPEVANELRLTELQQLRLDEYEDQAGDLLELVRLVRAPLEFEREIHAHLRERLDSQTLAVLTPEQFAKWRQLTGPPAPQLTKRPLYHRISRPKE